jgi:hypothetical protein
MHRDTLRLIRLGKIFCVNPIFSSVFSRKMSGSGLALMNDLERVSVGIKHIRGVVPRIIFNSRPR